jgi:hypothetical protein
MATAGSLTLTGTPGLDDSGQGVAYTATVLDVTGAPAVPATLTLTITAPDSTISTVLIGGWTIVSPGIYRYVDLPTQIGVYRAGAVSTVPNAADDVTVTVAATSTLAWTPTSDDIASLLAQRTIDATGLPTGHFSATSSPTNSQVKLLVTDIAGEVAAACGPIPTLLNADARLVTIFGAASLVESSFEDANTALLTLYSNRYQLALQRLATAVAQVNQSGQVEPEGMPATPLFSFPDIAGDVYVDVTTKYTRW